MATLRCPECGSRWYERKEVEEFTTEWVCGRYGFYCRSVLEFGYKKPGEADREVRKEFLFELFISLN